MMVTMVMMMMIDIMNYDYCLLLIVTQTINPTVHGSSRQPSNPVTPAFWGTSLHEFGV